MGGGIGGGGEAHENHPDLAEDEEDETKRADNLHEGASAGISLLRWQGGREREREREHTSEESQVRLEGVCEGRRRRKGGEGG